MDATQVLARQPLLKSPNRAHSRGELLWATGLLGVIVAVVLATGNAQFGGMDGGNLANASWEFLIGRKPYQQFITATPPLFLIGGKLAYILFGVHWSSFVYIGACFVVATFWLHWLLLKQLPLTAPWRLALAVATQAVTTMQIGWWWYNHTTATLAAMFITAVFVLQLGTRNQRQWLGLILTSAAVMLCKVNVAAPLIAGCYGVMLLQRDLRKMAAASLGISTAISLLVLLCCKINPLALLQAYYFAKGRLSWSNTQRYLLEFWCAESVMAQIAACALLLFLVVIMGRSLIHARRIRRDWALLACGVVGISVSIFAMATNSEGKTVELPLVLIVTVILAKCSYDELTPVRLRKPAIWLVFSAMLLLIVSASFQAVHRERIRAIGPDMFFEDAPLAEMRFPEFFSGIKAGPRLQQTVAEMDRVLRAFGCIDQPHARVYFGPRVDFGFPAFHIRNQKGVPLWWGGNGEMDPQIEQRAVERFISTDYPLCIFLRDDKRKELTYTYMPESLTRYLDTHYRVLKTPNLTIHVTKQWSLPPGLDDNVRN